MIKISSRSGRKNIIKYIYENEEEFIATGLTDVPIDRIHTAVVGDYVKSSNGYYLPVLRIDKFRKHTLIRPVYFLKVMFPLGHMIATDYYQDTDSIRYKYLNFSRDGAIKRKIPTARLKMMVHYLANGMDIYDAYFCAYCVKCPRTTEGYIDLENKLRQILETDTFINLLKEYKVVDTLKDALAKEGVSKEYIAKYMKDILEDKESKPDLKKMVLQNILNIQNTNSNGFQPKIDNILQGHISEDAYVIIENDNENHHVIEQTSLRSRLLESEIKNS
jgi:hypothetical protein